MTVEELKTLVDSGKLVRHHSASRRGYETRKLPEGHVETYNGKFGKGCIHVTPRWDTTQYVDLTYYVVVEERKEEK